MAKSPPRTRFLLIRTSKHTGIFFMRKKGEELCLGGTELSKKGRTARLSGQNVSRHRIKNQGDPSLGPPMKKWHETTAEIWLVSNLNPGIEHLMTG